MRIKITDIQRFSLHDGPGIRTTVFFARCPMRCVWCHNPECQFAEPLLRFTQSLCIRCGACMEACPQEVHRIVGEVHSLRRDDCDLCGKCAQACPTGALEIVTRSATVEEIVAEVARDKPFYAASGGGMTISGGEPLAQMKGAQTLLLAAKKEGIHTAAETCGYVPWKNFEPLLDAVDLWLYDVKHIDPKRHHALTGAANRRILANLGRLLEAKAKVILRLPIIPGQNDDEDSILRLVRWIKERDSLGEVHLMPYNRLAEAKYESIGRDYALRGLLQPTPESLEEIKAGLEELGLQVKVGG